MVSTAAIKILVPNLLFRPHTPWAAEVSSYADMVQVGGSLGTVSFEKSKANKEGLRLSRDWVLKREAVRLQKCENEEKVALKSRGKIMKVEKVTSRLLISSL